MGYSTHPELQLNTAGVPQRNALVTASRVCIRYPGCADCSLDHLSLEICEGDRVAVIGPSGGGKTTLLRALEGSLKPTAGQVIRRGSVALVYQDLRLVAERSVLSNVCSGAFGELKPWQGIVRFPESIQVRAMDLLEDLGLAQLHNRRVGSLSGGQRQRVAIARALLSRPQVLIADEPIASLDRRNAKRIAELLENLQRKYTFALVVSIHDPAMAPGFFSRYLAVDDGKVDELDPAMFGPTGDFRQYEFAGKSNQINRAYGEPQETELANAFVPPSADWKPVGHKRHLPEVVPLEDQDRAVGAVSRAATWAWRAGMLAVLVAALAWSASALQLKGSSFKGAFTGVSSFLKGVVPGSWAEFINLPWATLGASLLQTVQMALWGTVMGIVISFPFAVLASRQTGPAGIRWIVRFLLNGVRTVPSIFWALLFVAFVGLGPVSGVFALAAYSSGYLTKFFYEGLEDADGRPASALAALGASRLQTFLWAIFPAARPALIGACLFMFEYNIRAGSVLGVVGAGGIGQDLMYYIEWRQFPSAAAGLLMLLGIVVALDGLSQWWRRRLTHQRGM